jgi:preprotein translocase subunit SecA
MFRAGADGLEDGVARPKLFGSARTAVPGQADDARVLRWCRDVVSQVNALGPEMQARTDEGLRALTGSFRGRLSRGERLDDLLPEAFAAVREAAARTLGQRHFDVQVMGGAVLHLGKIAEMRTGEGKTLTATLPAYLNALTGAGVHVITANDYLAGRDAEWMGPVYRFLGLTAGLLQPEQRPDAAARRGEYGADVTYGAWEQFGYDYLRDNLVWSRDECVQRGRGFAIVDEADLILIDEMRTPMIISGPAERADSRHAAYAALAARLGPGEHYEIDERGRAVSLTENGAQVVEDHFGIMNLYDAANLELIHYVQNALKAKEVYRKDRDYIVAGGEAVIIDEASGRLHHGRRYDDGIHEAIEAKEGLTVRPAQQTLGSVLMWDYLGQYQRLTGMTGTASSEVEVYRQIYQLAVVTIPTNKPMIRIDHPDALYRSRESKLTALADETGARHATGQPVLIGAVSIEEAQGISGLLTERGTSHTVLTALNHEREAQVIADAARLGAVTVIAKMAGRGVDIILGGADGAERDDVADRGGLCVLGADRPAIRRLEMHTRGRAGRQGDPGEAKFFVSFDDDLVKSAVPAKSAAFAGRHHPEGDPFGPVSAALSKAQARVAASTAAWLVGSRESDQVLADQQHVIYAERALVARGEDLGDRVRNLIDTVVRAQVATAGEQGLDADRFWRGLRYLYPVSIVPPAAARSGGPISRGSLSDLAEQAAADARRAYRRREQELGTADIRELERRVILSILDRGWREHLEAMPELLNGIAMRTAGAAALAEYRREGALLFNRMREAANREIVRTLFHIRIEQPGTAPPA